VFARLLAMQLTAGGRKLRVALLEPSPPEAAAADAELDLRVSAIAPAARAILEHAGVWEALSAERAFPYERMCVWQCEGKAGESRSLSFDAAESGEPELGHIVENRAVRSAAWRLVERDPLLTMISGKRLAGLTERVANCAIELDDGSRLSARLVIGADGARSRVRDLLGVEFRNRSYGQSAIVAHIATELPHAATAWQRFLPAGPVALLPLADGRCSLVWSCPDEQAAELRELPADEFNTRLEEAVDGVLGAMECTTERACFPLAMGYARHYTGMRFALIGDAAHQVHPLAGQGVNLGLFDAAVLAEGLAEHLARPLADPGDPLVLRRYERARKGDNLLTLGTMDAINGLFSGPAAALGGIGLDVVQGVAPLKAFFSAYATGRSRSLPAAARATRL